ncbi:hypothetical protein [Allokutzneria albata]|uniref:Uncharacterized protein n=1 Tax=Allokutzneria albata TaxID=211114 RepID=A0A1G9YMY3_ALLAB|nr:hypothetical protein [Allokutzneria albata]SDN10392.1 hypothetical protein SAMN04489726_4932 [Allokutzneria albata]
MIRLGVLAPLAVLGAVLAGSGLLGAPAADGEPDRPPVEVIETGSVLHADLHGPGTGVTGTILSERVTAIRGTT